MSLLLASRSLPECFYDALSPDVILCEPEQHFFEIRAEIDRRVRPKNGNERIRRPVMVFFRTKKALLDFNASSQARQLKELCVVQTITEEVDPTEKEGLFQKATTAGVVSLLIRDYGRGTDFKCFDDNVLVAGGVHVIQAFYSTDCSEFTQIKGRTARQGSDGSFRLVIALFLYRCGFKLVWTDISSLPQYGAWCRRPEDRPWN